MPLERLGPYRIEKTLGRGGMGAVYAAVHLESGERAAVKVLSPTLADSTHFRDRFHAEVETLKKLQHPHIVRLFGWGEDQNHLFYAMELVEGRSLEDELGAGRRFTWREVTQIGIAVCGALKHAHDHGVIHRDLKPANLLWSEAGHVKLSDFGIAKLFGGTNITAIGGIIGTADYMSPEQAEGRVVTVRSDLFSLGSVLFALLTGKPPFSANSIPAVLHRLRFESPPPLRRQCPDAPAELEQIVEQLLQKDPQDRFATALLLANRLKAMLHGLSVAPSTSLSPAPEPAVPSAQTDEHGTLRDRNAGTLGRTQETPTRGGSQLPPDGLAQTIATDAASVALPAATKDSVTTPAPAPASRTHFSTVTDDERRRAAHLEPESTPSSERGVVLGLGLVLTVIAAIAVWALLPPSADRLFGQLRTAAVEDDALKEAMPKLDSFLARFPTDPRRDEVLAWKECAECLRLQGPLTLRELSSGGEALSPIERRLLQALRLRSKSPDESRAAFAEVAEQLDSTPDETNARYVALARRMVARLRHAAPEQTEPR